MRIAIDGPSGVGKTTAGMALAAELALPFLDTGATYRAVARIALDQEVRTDDRQRLADIARALRLERGGAQFQVAGVDPGRLTGNQVDQAASQVAEHPQVRQELVAKQRQCAADGIVMAGRDIGTVVLKDIADLKLYLDASEQERARRRAGQRAGQRLSQVSSQIASRDRRDTHRSASPLAQAPDAVRIDTESMDPQQVLQAALEAVAAARKGSAPR